MAFIQRRQYLESIERTRVSEGRDLSEGLRLDRNERVGMWPKQFLSDIFSSVPDYLLSVYPDSAQLYRKLAKFHRVGENDLLLTAGIDGGLKALFEIMTAPGDLVGVASPTYAMYQVYANLFQVQLFEIGYEDNFEFRFRQFDEFLTKRPTVFFLPNPNQPIESVFSLDDLEEFSQKTRAANCLFVIDEAYHLFGSESGVELIEKYENVVVARTFSKGFGAPSIRLGYLISNVDNMKILTKTRFAHESNALTNAVAEYLLDNYDIVSAYNDLVIEARAVLQSRISQLGIPARGRAGNFLLLDLKTTTRAQSFVDFLRARKVYIKGPCTKPWDRFVTITIGPIAVMERFVDETRAFLTKESVGIAVASSAGLA